jgi:Protein of unknown function (DUF4242)
MGDGTMPRFIIERNFAEKLELAAWKEGNNLIERINDEEGVKWILSFLSADKRKTYCLYEAPNAEAIRTAAVRANIPADVITMVDEVNPAMFA